ncbi:MAG: Hpt domain-containing protein, partial [Motiliproteus sp.]|nr:Hpt domain-containing protein [Motiliproteus sp.]
MASVINTFINDIPVEVDQVRQDANNGNLQGVAVRAHKIKGAAGNVASKQLQSVALALELASKEENQLEVDRSISELVATLASLRQRLQQKLDEMGG